MPDTINPQTVTPLILTFNEAPNLRRALERLAWAKEIIVVDSFSTDGTPDIARDFPRTFVVERTFDTHAQQWNFGVSRVRTPWVLSLDADYILPEDFASELESLRLDEEISAYVARFRYCVFGKPLRGTLYPPRAVLFSKERCRYLQDGHTQLLQFEGQSSLLKGIIDHDDRKPVAQWLRAQDRYAMLESIKLAETPASSLDVQDRIRKKIIFAPVLMFFLTLFGKGLILDGWPGWFYVFQRTMAEILLSLKLLESKLSGKSKDRGGKQDGS